MLGTICGLSSAAIYTCANICLKAAANCDPFWVAAIKALPTAILAAGLVGYGNLRGRPFGLSARTTVALIATGLAAQLGGNVGFQYALEGCGLALAVPLTLGTIIIGGALLGRFWLGEPVTPRTALAMVLLLVAIPILTWGAKQEAPALATVAATGNPLFWLVGAMAACASGFAYALQGAVLRRMANLRAPVAATLLVLSATGVVSLGPISLARIGWDGMLATDPSDFANMIFAGLFNAVGFFTLSKALKLISVVQVNALNASQAAMAAAAGVMFFNEIPTAAMFLGIGLTVAGVMLIDRGRRDE